MVIINERILPIVREAVLNQRYGEPRFREEFAPLFEDFIASGKEKDEYHGYAFGLVFFSSSVPEYEKYLARNTRSD